MTWHHYPATNQVSPLATVEQWHLRLDGVSVARIWMDGDWWSAFIQRGDDFANLMFDETDYTIEQVQSFVEMAYENLKGRRIA